MAAQSGTGAKSPLPHHTIVVCPELAALAPPVVREVCWHFGCKHTATASIIIVLISAMVAPACYMEALSAPFKIPAGICRKQIPELVVPP